MSNAAALGAFGAFIAAYLIIIVIVCIISILVLIFKTVLNCLIINKAEGNWWKGLIPFYNRYTLYTLAFNQKTAVMMFIIYMITYVATFIINGFSRASQAVSNVAQGSSSSSTGAILGVMAGASLIIALISWLVAIVQLVIRCIYQFAIGKSFGMETWFNVLSIFFPTITAAILAFGSAEYEGDTVDIIPD